ncbi:chromosome partitioning protein, ParB family [Paucidesulfovibrio gracilis DSM 16080]|uniref:Chromosome partitioning protein, ParB family n=1 Tax=Paucidesulfovibrio gracilis DSM 16080 TaxID=1121449 RepID=A0A1T4XNB3_9BACT|nr:ParB/RepB/Spo0J family partition protein [Paucidesulfovibrio gracilis]SKA91014.1 chromosome partitioning protein, ParB family [Paucidesulfovibrio gracilis DSM 16080]
MSAGSRGLGRGLDALLGGTQQKDEPVNPSEVRQLPIASICPNPHQPRIEFSEQGLADLSASIKTQGVLQPILVRPLENNQYELVAGERRLRASKLAGLREIPALVREMDDQESLAIALIENLQREDLNAIEEALGYRQLMDQFGVNQEALAKSLGKSRSALANSMRLLNLPEPVQNDIRQGRITAGHGRAIMSVTDETVANELHARILKQGMSVRQAEAEAGFWKEHGTLPSHGQGESADQAPRRAAGKRKKDVDPDLAEVQSMISRTLGRKVSVSGTASKGKLTLPFSSLDDLRRLAEMLGGEQG